MQFTVCESDSDILEAYFKSTSLSYLRQIYSSIRFLILDPMIDF